ncbi:uncharacterized protein QC761_103295 [Podospora bellae-mahoneyi]|uniref:Uncharacterized protein n=1 Tax=Podospora bellae-mahoneyi TaxID=2093777 RepID=A0ABR0FUM4_9PEZI|nr:hypothetical protein QC761_103295 [Podospora bellae-mahoneyi]
MAICGSGRLVFLPARNSNSHPQTQGKYHAKQKPNPFNNKNQSTVSNLAAFQPARMPKTKRNENDLSTNERKKSTENCQPRHLRSISRGREERFMQAIHKMTKELCQLSPLHTIRKPHQISKKRVSYS